MHVVGTAGHVDHGKSSLVLALTGTNPDRWIEEQLRGMTLDLGFAHLRYPDGVEAGIIDVPGHERFVHNMLAGAAGMELLLLVVAANEGPRPQTREHLAILNYLDVRRAITVLTKRDLVDDAELEVASELVRDAVRGSVAEGAPVVAVSSHTGEGLDDLRVAIHDALVALPERAPDAPPYLPVDRVFALPGHGTIVTGTLIQGVLAIGDTLAVQPMGLHARIRSLHVFGERRDRVSAGMRVAANVPSIDREAIGRGAVLAGDELAAGRSFGVRFRAWDEHRARLRRRTPVRAYIGAAEILATLVFEGAPPKSSDEVHATLHLREPSVAFPGAPFVVRGVSPKWLLGGGRITAAGAADESSETIGDDAVVRALARNRTAPVTAAEIATLANVREEVAQARLEVLVETGVARRVARPAAFVDGRSAAELLARTVDHLARREAEAPWIAGTTSRVLAGLVGEEEARLLRLLAAFAEDGAIQQRGGYYATLGHVPKLSLEQREFFDRAIAIDPAQPLAPAALEAVTGEIRRSRIPGLSAAFDTLVASGALVKVGEHVYRGTQLAELRARLETALRATGEITPAAFRDAAGLSRKFIVPLLEFFDATRVTVRDGDARRLIRR